MVNPDQQGFVNDGRDRACKASERRIRAEVRDEYAERLLKASFWKRMRLQREIEREVRRRLSTLAPPDALY